jgi:Amt family ammonium transporter
MRRLGAAIGAISVLLLTASPVAAADGGELNSGDTAWLLTATALVMIMLPGLALFYGGLVRRKNVLSTIMASFFVLALVSVVWVLWGYSLAFAPDAFGGLIGGLDFIGFSNVTGAVDPRYAPTTPHVLFAGFQLMFAAITPALITGAFAERKRFGAFVLFTIAWTTLVYSPLAHWVWAPGGWLRAMGAIDFAGGTVVHISSGVSAMVVALVIGRRVTNGDRMQPHDVPMTVLGAGLLWFGWFGFNAGSALGATGQAANALIVTNTAAGAATIAWALASYMHKRKVSVVGAAAGSIAGLVAITPASGYVTAGGAVIIGILAGGVCYAAILLRERLKVDDALDVWAVHGVGGTLGAIATGVFAVAAIGGVKGAIDGNVAQVGTQLIAVAATWAFAGISTFVIIKAIDIVLGLRVAPSDEEMGLDLALHGEAAYQT